VAWHHLPPICSTPELLRLLVLLVDVLNTCQGFRTSRAVYLWWSVRRRLLWTKPANLAALWNRYPHLRIKCRVWWPESCTLTNVTPFLLVSLNLYVRCCDVSSSATFLLFLLLHYCWLVSFRVSCTCLDLVGETRQVAERIRALEKASEGTDSLWSDPRHRRAIVLFQDRSQHIGEAIDGCQRSLMTMYSVMLPRNPLPGSFPQLLDAFSPSQRIHQLIELNLVAGANFALWWIRKWHPRLNYSSMSLGFPSGGVRLRVHMDATLQPARRIIARLLWEDAAFFREHKSPRSRWLWSADVVMIILHMWNARVFVFESFYQKFCFILKAFYISVFSAFTAILFKDAQTRIGGALSLFMLVM
jgi:hypothetical protein